MDRRGFLKLMSMAAGAIALPSAAQPAAPMEFAVGGVIPAPDPLLLIGESSPCFLSSRVWRHYEFLNLGLGGQLKRIELHFEFVRKLRAGSDIEQMFEPISFSDEAGKSWTYMVTDIEHKLFGARDELVERVRGQILGPTKHLVSPPRKRAHDGV